jgi:hypothetical protein
MDVGLAPSRRFWPVLLLALSATLLAPRRVAAADTLSDPLALELKAAGDAAMASLRYADALEAYERASAIEGHPSLLFNRARALQALHRYAEALDYFEEFRHRAPPDLLARAGPLEQLMVQLRNQVTTLVVACNLDGATILVRGVKVGTTPLAGPVRLNAGPARVTVTADGAVPFERDLTLTGGGEQRLEVELQKRKPPGRLTVRSPVGGALVFVDDRRLGNAPAEVALRAGTHRVRVVRPDYQTVHTTVTIADGETKVLAVELERNPGILRQWWFWTGAGAVVAGGVALGIALSTERAADRGDIAPGVIAAPLRF